MDSTYERYVEPLNNRLRKLETTLPRPNSEIEDSLAQLSLKEISIAKIDRLEDIETVVKGFNEVRSSQPEKTGTFKRYFSTCSHPPKGYEQGTRRCIRDATNSL